MKGIIQHILTWVLLGCLMGVNVTPLFISKVKKQPIKVVIDAHNDSVPADGNEEKTESLKFAKNEFSVQCIPLDVLYKHFFEHPRCSKLKVFMPIALPPPKANA